MDYLYQINEIWTTIPKYQQRSSLFRNIWEVVIFVVFLLYNHQCKQQTLLLKCCATMWTECKQQRRINTILKNEFLKCLQQNRYDTIYKNIYTSNTREYGWIFWLEFAPSLWLLEDALHILLYILSTQTTSIRTDFVFFLVYTAKSVSAIYWAEQTHKSQPQRRLIVLQIIYIYLFFFNIHNFSVRVLWSAPWQL